MIEFSCADFTFPVVDRRTALSLIKLLGFDFVDIGLFARSEHFSPGALLASPRSYTAQVREDLGAAGLRPSDVFLQIGADPAECAANHPDPSVRASNRDVFMRSLECCAELGCAHLTGLPGVLHVDVAPEQDVALSAEVAAWRLEQCASAGVRYAIEPHVGSLCPDVASTRAFLEQTPGLTLTLDYGHFIMAGEDSASVHPLLPSASHIHVRGGAPGRLQTSFDENIIDFPAMIAGLQGAGYDGFLVLEYVWIAWQHCNRCDNVSETILLRRALEAALAGAGKKV